MEEPAFSLPLLKKKEPRFQLKLETRLRNIFVTQLEDHGLPHSGEQEDNINYIPIITEVRIVQKAIANHCTILAKKTSTKMIIKAFTSWHVAKSHLTTQKSSNSILKTGVNTLQKTLVLKTQVQLDDVNRQLVQKRLEIKDRTRALEQRKAALLEKQEETKERAVKFEKFVKENEVKRQRTLKKYQLEKKENSLKDEEKSRLHEELKHLQTRHQRLKERVDKYKIYEKYMVKILALLPDGQKSYLEYGSDSLVMPIIRRHETLSITQQDLLQRLTSLTEEVDSSRCNLESLKLEYSTNRLVFNKELSELQTQCDQTREKNKQLDMTLYTRYDHFRSQIEEIGCLLQAVKNLAQQCHLKHYGPLQGMGSMTMMDMIKEFILDLVDTERRALQITHSNSELMKTSKHKESKRPALTVNSSSKVDLKCSTKPVEMN